MSYLFFSAVCGFLLGVLVLGLMFRLSNGRIHLDRTVLPRWVILLLMVLLLGGIFNVGRFAYHNQTCVSEIRDKLAEQNIVLGLNEPSADPATEEQRRIQIFKRYADTYANTLEEEC